MTPFTGQLTRLGLNGAQAIVWQDRSFYMKAFLSVVVRVRGIFVTEVE